MTITMIYAPMRDAVSIMRVLDGERRRLCILCKFGQQPAEIYAAIRGELTDTERGEVTRALGLDGGDAA